MSNEIAVQSPDAPAVSSTGEKLPWSPKQIGLITRTVARGATPDELGLFLYTANRTGLDPLTRQVHFVKRRVWSKEKSAYDEVGTIQTGIDGYRAIAARTGELAGIEDAVYDSEDKDHPNKASVTVYRLVGGSRVPFTASARWSEYAAVHPKTGEVMGLWKKMPYLMLAKCAESLALRKAFAFNLSGLYTNEEMSQADAPVVPVRVLEEVKTVVAQEKKAAAEALMRSDHQPLSEPEETTADKAIEVGEESASIPIDVASILAHEENESPYAKNMREGMESVQSKE